MSLSDRSGRDDARRKHYKPLKVQLTDGKVVSFGAVEGEK